jgi:hypothetical protein
MFAGDRCEAERTGIVHCSREVVLARERPGRGDERNARTRAQCRSAHQSRPVSGLGARVMHFNGRARITDAT